MKLKLVFILPVVCLGFQLAFSQSPITYKWWNPAQNSFLVIEGQAWPNKVAYTYDRLPASAEQTVTKAVWNLSRQSAGLLIRFKSNATDIRVRYSVDGKLDKLHMPATGVSGVDLYAVNKHGGWEWSGRKYKYGDTIEYHFQSLNNDYAHEYRLYLPLYNSVKWLEVGVPVNDTIIPLPVREDKPIVVYGTSITQGACASRPGMAWTAIMGRRLDRPVINLGFSGNGHLDKSIIDMMVKLDAKIFVLDCLPNLIGFSADTVIDRLIRAVKTLKGKKPDIPILVVEGADPSIESLDPSRFRIFKKVNEAARLAFAEMKAEGIQNIYFLPAKDIGLGNESSVEGVHPNDVGMEQYATAYTKCIQKILHEPDGEYSTMQPCIQYRDHSYDWEARHRELLKINKEHPPEIVFLGNSIIHSSGGQPGEPVRQGEDFWKGFLDLKGIRNFGCGCDRIENVLWRVYHGELDTYYAKQVIILIGTNNLEFNTDNEIIAGLQLVVNAVKIRQPTTKILLLGLFPRKELEQRVVILNEQIMQLSGNENVIYANPGTSLLGTSGKINEFFFVEGLYLNAAGYAGIAKSLTPYLVSGSIR